MVKKRRTKKGIVYNRKGKLVLRQIDKTGRNYILHQTPKGKKYVRVRKRKGGTKTKRLYEGSKYKSDGGGTKKLNL